MESGLAKQDILPPLRSVCETGNEKERTHGAFLSFKLLSKALYRVLCRDGFPKALLIRHFVDVTEAYRFCLNLCTKHILDCRGFCGLSQHVGLYRKKPGPLSDEIWKGCLKT